MMAKAIWQLKWRIVVGIIISACIIGFFYWLKQNLVYSDTVLEFGTTAGKIEIQGPDEVSLEAVSNSFFILRQVGQDSIEGKPVVNWSDNHFWYQKQPIRSGFWNMVSSQAVEFKLESSTPVTVIIWKSPQDIAMANGLTLIILIVLWVCVLSLKTKK